MSGSSKKKVYIQTRVKEGIITLPSAKGIKLDYLTLSAQTREIPNILEKIEEDSYRFNWLWEEYPLKPETYKDLIDSLPQELRKREIDKYFYLCDKSIG